MKHLMVLLISLGLGFAASAVPSARSNYRGGAGKTVVVVSPRAYYQPYYSPYSSFGWAYGSPYYGYSPYWGFANNTPVRETKADLAIEQIRNDYSYQISNVRHDDSLSKKERKDRIRQLKHERDQAIIEAKQKYY